MTFNTVDVLTRSIWKLRSLEFCLSYVSGSTTRDFRYGRKPGSDVEGIHRGSVTDTYRPVLPSGWDPLCPEKTVNRNYTPGERSELRRFLGWRQILRRCVGGTGGGEWTPVCVGKLRWSERVQDGVKESVYKRDYFRNR